MITANDGEGQQLESAAGASSVTDKAPELTFDASRYWSYLEGIDATDEEKTALLETLWSMMQRFVEIGFGEDPVQTVIPALIRAGLEETGDAAEERSAVRRGFDAVTTLRNGEEESQ